MSSLTDKVDQHVPLSSVVGGVGQKELDQSPVHRLFPLGRLHVSVQEVVTAFNLKERDKTRGGGCSTDLKQLCCPTSSTNNTKVMEI